MSLGRLLRTIVHLRRRQVVGVDGSQKRVDVCTANAARMGIENAEFIYVEPGSRLPFDDESFDDNTKSHC